jgi:hypothetical protein
MSAHRLARQREIQMNTETITTSTWIDPYDASYITMAQDSQSGSMYPVTDCCGASATGSMGGTACRSCYAEIPAHYGMWFENALMAIQQGYVPSTDLLEENDLQSLIFAPESKGKFALVGTPTRKGWRLQCGWIDRVATDDWDWDNNCEMPEGTGDEYVYFTDGLMGITPQSHMGIPTQHLINAQNETWGVYVLQISDHAIDQQSVILYNEPLYTY